MKKAKKTKTKTKTKVLPEYYTFPFQYLHSEYLGDIDTITLNSRAEIKKKYSTKVRDGKDKTLQGDEAFSFLRSFLDEIESSIQPLLSQHSPFFWIHLYRRVGIGHISAKSEKSDTSTLAAVRKTVEAAIFKFGDLSNTDDMGLSNDIEATLVLDGLFYEIFSKAGKNDQEIKAFWLLYQNQWILKGYKRTDHTTIYILEGYAYEYWRAMANMRAIAKGAVLNVTADGTWREIRSESLNRLILSYDQRLMAGQSYLSTAKGLISFNTKTKLNENKSKSNIIFATYNYDRTPFIKIVPTKKVPDDTIGNFVPVSLDKDSFLKAHEIFKVPFKKKWDFELHNVFLFFTAVSIYVMTLRAHGAPSSEFAIFQFLQRAYIQDNTNLDELTEKLIDTLYQAEQITQSESRSEPFAQEIKNICKSFFLSTEGQRRISLWSHGPRPIIIPFADTNIIDIGGIQGILENMFFGVKENQQQRGYELEKTLRHETKARGFQLLPDRILRKTDETFRETDLAIRVHNTLVLCDCRSIERPLDLIIGKPSTLAYRNKLIDKKLDQVLKIKAFINDDLKGQNYDFSWAERVISVGVLPDTEWIHSEEKDYWIDRDRNLPTIMSVEEFFKEINLISSSKKNILQSRDNH